MLRNKSDLIVAALLIMMGITSSVIFDWIAGLGWFVAFMLQICYVFRDRRLADLMEYLSHGQDDYQK